MSAPPHSAIHATNYVGPNGEEIVAPRTGVTNEGTGGAAPALPTIAKPLTEEEKKAVEEMARVRRRLTVTGASDTIDGGVEQMNVDETEAGASSGRAKAPACAVSEYSGVSKKGHAPYNPRKKNQDALIMAEDPLTNTLVLCVLDGHGEHGDGVSYHVRDCLPGVLFSHPAWATDVKEACREAILRVEDQVIRNFRIDTEFSGTTLSMAIIRGNRITGVNIGDSRIIIAQRNPNDESKYLVDEFTTDHKPDSPLERERIVACGGRVFAVEYDDGIDGPARVWLGHMDVPGLAMSRSLGDAVAHMAGVISEPEFSERDLDPEKDRFIIVATDGLWEFMDNDLCTEIASQMSGPSECVDRLVKEANARWMKEEQVIDDTTVIVANLFEHGFALLGFMLQTVAASSCDCYINGQCKTSDECAAAIQDAASSIITWVIVIICLVVAAIITSCICCCYCTAKATVAAVDHFENAERDHHSVQH